MMMMMTRQLQLQAILTGPQENEACRGVVRVSIHISEGRE